MGVRGIDNAQAAAKRIANNLQKPVGIYESLITPDLYEVFADHDAAYDNYTFVQDVHPDKYKKSDRQFLVISAGEETVFEEEEFYQHLLDTEDGLSAHDYFCDVTVFTIEDGKFVQVAKEDFTWSVKYQKG